MKGLLLKDNDEWFIQTEEQKLLPLCEDFCGGISTSESFIWMDSVYKELDIVEYDTTMVYIEPSPEIHCNRGDTKVVAILLSEWDRIFEGFTGGLKQIAPSGNYKQFIQYMKENYHPPKVKK